jgi:hypothetical protein
MDEMKSISNNITNALQECRSIGIGDTSTYQKLNNTIFHFVFDIWITVKRNYGSYEGSSK